MSLDAATFREMKHRIAAAIGFYQRRNNLSVSASPRTAVFSTGDLGAAEMTLHGKIRRSMAAAIALAVVWPGTASAQGQFQPQAPQAGQNPICVRLETQLASIERGGGDPSRAATVRRFEDAVNAQQANVDRLNQQARRLGCQSAGIFSIFTSQPPQCTSLMAQVDQARSGLDRAMSDLQRSQYRRR